MFSLVRALLSRYSAAPTVVGLGFVRRVHLYYGAIRLLTPVHAGRAAIAFSGRTAVPLAASDEVSRFSYMQFLSVPGVYDYGGLPADSRLRPLACGLPHLTTGSASHSSLFEAPYPAH